MIEEQFKILKFLTDATGKIDTNELANRVNLTPKQLIEQVQDMAQAGFLKRVGGGYAITEKAKNALKATYPVPNDSKFEFYNGLGQPSGTLAATAKEFYDAAQKVDAASLEFHLYRGDFGNWFRSAVNDVKFADELDNIKKTELKGEDLRNAITKATKTRYSL